jgi:hypothetical protein
MKETSAADIKIEVLRDLLQKPLNDRLTKTAEPTTFNSTKAGHVIKLIVGFVQEYGGLTLPEIETLLRNVNVTVNTRQVTGYLLCAKSLRWIVEKRKGSEDYFFATNLPDAATLKFKKSPTLVGDKLRRRTLIRDHWKKNDALRYRGIEEVFGGSLI